ncbi:MAG TPA: glycosyltransferase family 39 protein [Candidatus Polarisedimenticolia bacterium]|nr:glycosyltransferase family 39 protein [Candidatus Polarisedimenticolia bacterium]
MLSALPHASAVVDEPAHLTAGWLAVARGDLHVNREHPPLMKVLAGLALRPLDPVLPPEDPALGPRSGEDFLFGYSRAFLYRANDADRLLSRARLPVVAVTLAAGAALFLWGRALLGGGAALAALALYAFEPSLLAHGRLVTTDMGGAALALAAIACAERAQASGRWRLRPGIRGLGGWDVLAGIMLGLALAARYSSALLPPLMALAVVLDGRRPARVRLAGLAVSVLVALAALQAVYVLVGGAGAAGLPVPGAWREGLELARHKNAEVEGPGFLNGEYAADGWWSYFVLALAMKGTLPMLALAGAGLALLTVGAGGSRGGAARWIWIALPPAALVAMTTALTQAQIGLRYVLAAFPFLCLAGGAAAAALASVPARRAGAAAAVALLGWHAGEALAIHPHHLAYFNQASGGPARGHLRLTDSNVDWGQDLVGLRRWMAREGVDRIHLYYFGTADPDYYGIVRETAPGPGYYAVSATHLAGVYLPDRRYLAPFLALTPRAHIGYSIFVYRFDSTPAFLTTPIRRP